MFDSKLSQGGSELFHLSFEVVDLGGRDLGGERVERLRVRLVRLKGRDPNRTTPAKRERLAWKWIEESYEKAMYMMG